MRRQLENQKIKRRKEKKKTKTKKPKEQRGEALESDGVTDLSGGQQSGQTGRKNRCTKRKGKDKPELVRINWNLLTAFDSNTW